MTVFGRNLRALAGKEGGDALCARLRAAAGDAAHYRFLAAWNGSVVPAWMDKSGAARALHSLVDPEREGRRLAGEDGAGRYDVSQLQRLLDSFVIDRPDISSVRGTCALTKGIPGNLHLKQPYCGVSYRA
ncbi:MAG: hypothetical protein MdMp014T_2068 [Treponematales bacterium]